MTTGAKKLVLHGKLEECSHDVLKLTVLACNEHQGERCRDLWHKLKVVNTEKLGNGAKQVCREIECGCQEACGAGQHRSGRTEEVFVQGKGKILCDFIRRA